VNHLEVEAIQDA
jgi:hypothetical protein